MAAWIKPKMAHKHMVQKLLQVRAHLILCFRAEPKIEMVKGDDGKWQIVEKKSLTGLHGWIPVSEKNLPFELTASFLLMADRPGVPLPIKLQEQHKALFPLDVPITEASGRDLAAWARGGDKISPTDEMSPTDWVLRITTATTVAALKAIGTELGKATLDPGNRDALRTQFKARLAALAPSKKKPATAPTAAEIPWSS